jgi:hypothetical protein
MAMTAECFVADVSCVDAHLCALCRYRFNAASIDFVMAFTLVHTV